MRLVLAVISEDLFVDFNVHVHVHTVVCICYILSDKIADFKFEGSVDPNSHGNVLSKSYSHTCRPTSV